MTGASTISLGTHSTECLQLDTQNLQIPDISVRVVHALRSCSLFKKAPPQELTKLNAQQLSEVLKTVVDEFVNSREKLDSFAQLAEWIPLETLQDVVRTNYPEHVDALTTAQQMFKDAKHYLETTDKDLSPSLRTRLNQMLESLVSVLESIISAFGIAQFFQPAENDFHADSKAHKIMMLITLFSTLSALLLPILGAALGASIIGGTFLAIGVISLIYPYVKPAPTVLPKAENWTRKIQLKTLVVTDGRKGIADSIARTLIESKASKSHAMLIGKSGVGKTEAVKAFAQAVERGEYPELAGKQVFYINTADLVNGSEMFSSANKNLQKLNEAIGRHRENIILVFDEIHLACQSREQSVLGDQLKTLLDPGKENFPYCIGMTTEEEFYRDIHANNPAFARRFKRITVDNTNEAETLEILNNTVLQQAPKILLENGILEKLFTKTVENFSENAAQPATSLKILSSCIQRTAESQKSGLEAKVELLRQEIYTRHIPGLQGQLPYQHHEYHEITKLKNEELRKLEESLVQEKSAKETFFKTRDHLAAARKLSLQTVVKVAQWNPNLSARQKKELNAFLLLTHFVTPALESQVRTQAVELGIKTIIDEAMVDDVILQEVENNKKVQAAVERGREALLETS